MTPTARHGLVKWLVLATFAGVFCIRGLSSYMQATPRNDFHFSLIGDRTGGAQPQIFGRVWREVDLLRPDFIVNVGDTIEGGREDRAAAEWAELRPMWKRYSRYPLYFTPGNHDIWSKASEELYVKETGFKPYYSFDYQDAHFTVLDNSRHPNLAEDQLTFLESDLKANANKNPKFVIFHRPFWIQPLTAGDTSFPLHRIVKQYGVQHVISGHGHRFVRIVRDGVVYMEVGSSGGNMTGNLKQGLGFRSGIFYHHIWGRVKGDQVSFTVKEIDGMFGAGRMFDAAEWDENGPKFEVADPGVSGKPQT
jgi:predicted phosphodiesterase